MHVSANQERLFVKVVFMNSAEWIPIEKDQTGMPIYGFFSDEPALFQVS
jgi:hypothetical protein